MVWTTWLTVFTVAFFVVISPGPNLAITIRNSLSHSRRLGLYTVLGMAAGSLVHITYCLAGLGVIIARSILLFNALKWVGAAYLAYLGIRALMARKHEPVEPGPAGPATLSAGGALRMGFLTDVLNPKATLFFLALFTQVLEPDTSLYARIIYGLTMVAIEIACYSAVAVLISHARVRNLFMAISHWVDRVTGAVLIGLSLRLALASRE